MTIESDLLDGMTALLGRRDLTQQEVQSWWNGAVDGGPDGDGMYPMTDSAGFVRQIPSPLKIRADLTDTSDFAQPILQLPSAAAGRDLFKAAPVGKTIYVDNYFGPDDDPPGEGDNNGPMQAAFAAFCALGEGASIVLGSPDYTISGPLPLPDHNIWSMASTGWSRITQLTPNTPIWLWEVSEARLLFNIEGIVGRWGTLVDGLVVPRQAQVEGMYPTVTGEVLAIMFCIKAKPGAALPGDPGGRNPLVNGIAEFRLNRILLENGYRGLALHPDFLVDYPLDTNLWGYKADMIMAGYEARGAVICQESTLGGPQVTIDNLYGGGPDMVEPILILTQVNGVKGRNWEVNNQPNAAFALNYCANLDISCRMELSHLTYNGAGLMIVNGAQTKGKIEIEFTSAFLDDGVDFAYGLVAASGCHLDVAVTMSKGITPATGFVPIKPQPYGDYNSTVQLTMIPHYRWEGSPVDVYTYERADAPQIRFPNTQTFAYWYEALTDSLSPTPASNGKPSGRWKMTRSGFVTMLTATVSAPITVGTLFCLIWRVRGGVVEAVTNFYTFHQAFADDTQRIYAVIPFDNGQAPTLSPISGHDFYEGDEFYMTVNTSVDFAPADVSVEMEMAVAYLEGTREQAIPVLKQLELDDYNPTIGTGWRARILKKTPASALSMINTVGGKYSLLFDPDDTGDPEVVYLTGTGLTSTGGAYEAPVVREALGNATGNPRNNFLGVIVG